MTTFKSIIEALPPELQREVEDFARYLFETRVAHGQTARRQPPTFAWAGALEELRDRYTSVELQHELSASRTKAT